MEKVLESDFYRSLPDTNSDSSWTILGKILQNGKRVFPFYVLIVYESVQSVQSLSHVPLFATPWTAARLPCTSPTPRAYSKSCQLSQWCHPTISSSFIRVFSSESVLCIRWPKSWSFSISISPSNEYSGLISCRMDWFDLLAIQGTLKSLLHHHSSKASILQHSDFFIVELSHSYMTTGKPIALTRWTFVCKVMSLLFNMLSRLIIAFLSRSYAATKFSPKILHATAKKDFASLNKDWQSHMPQLGPRGAK